jgi:hypothetical protein
VAEVAAVVAKADAIRVWEQQVHALNAQGVARRAPRPQPEPLSRYSGCGSLLFDDRTIRAHTRVSGVPAGERR